MAITRKPSIRRLLVVGLASAAVLACMVCIAILMVRSGHGMETYRTFWLVEEDWTSFLVFIAVTVAAIGVGLVHRWREARKWRELERRYGIPEGGQDDEQGRRGILWVGLRRRFRG